MSLPHHPAQPPAAPGAAATASDDDGVDDMPGLLPAGVAAAPQDAAGVTESKQEHAPAHASTASGSGDSGSDTDDSDDDDDDDIEESGDDADAHAAGYMTLFSRQSVRRLEEVWADATAAGLDVLTFKKHHNLDTYAWIKFVNYVRKCVAEGQPASAVVASLQAGPSVFAADAFLQPVLEDDSLLFDVEDEDDEEDQAVVHSQEASAGAAAGGAGAGPALTTDALQNQVASLSEQLEHAKAVIARLSALQEAGLEAHFKPDNDTYYFGSYGRVFIHEDMLKDTARTMSYRDSMYLNPEAFRDKIVLDVGCGTGVLSMFAARAGAKHVYAIDNSNIIDYARTIVTKNGLDTKITLFRGKAEEVVLPVSQVDIIVSEWMGYALLYESMLEAVLGARDKYLAPGGLMLPSVAVVHVSGMSADAWWKDRVQYWHDVYGFDMTVLKPLMVAEPHVEVVPAADIATPMQEYKVLDLVTVKPSELDFECPLSLVANKTCDMHGVVVSFDVLFYPSNKSDATQVTLSTSPLAKPTHWKQTVLPFDTPVAVTEGQTMTGTLKMYRDAVNPREYRFLLRLTAPVALEKAFHLV